MDTESSITILPVTYTIEWQDRNGHLHKETFTEADKAQTRLNELHRRYVSCEIRDLQISSL